MIPDRLQSKVSQCTCRSIVEDMIQQARVIDRLPSPYVYCELVGAHYVTRGVFSGGFLLLVTVPWHYPKCSSTLEALFHTAFSLYAVTGPKFRKTDGTSYEAAPALCPVPILPMTSSAFLESATQYRNVQP